MEWKEKLMSFGISEELAMRMSPDLLKIPYYPDQFTDINQLNTIMVQEGCTSLDWWSDLQTMLGKMMQQFVNAVPGIIMLAIGGAASYFLRNYKIGRVPLALVGLPLIGYGTWQIVQPYLVKP